MFDTRRSACIDDRGAAQLWKSKFISLKLGKFVAVIPSCFCAVVIPTLSLALCSLVPRIRQLGIIFVIWRSWLALSIL